MKGIPLGLVPRKTLWTGQKDATVVHIFIGTTTLPEIQVDLCQKDQSRFVKRQVCILLIEKLLTKYFICIRTNILVIWPENISEGEGSTREAQTTHEPEKTTTQGEGTVIWFKLNSKSHYY